MLGAPLSRRRALARSHERSFFMRKAAPVEELPHRRVNHLHATLLGETLGHFLKRSVRHVLKHLEDEVGTRIKRRARRLALLGRRNASRSPLQSRPCPRRRFADAKPLRGL